MTVFPVPVLSTAPKSVNVPRGFAFVNQRGGGKGIPRPLAAQVMARQRLKVAVDQRHQLVHGALVTFTPGDQELGYIPATRRTS
jgi:hypothetical protein